MVEPLTRPLLLADAGIWPILIFWAVFALIGNAAKKKQKLKQQQPQPGADPAAEFMAGPPGPARGGMMDELRRAMEELKRAEQQQTARDLGQGPGEGHGSLQAHDKAQAQEQLAAEWLANQKRKAASRPPKRSSQVALPGRRAPTKRTPAVPVTDDDMSSEVTVVSAEGEDYDNQAEQIALARRKAADRTVRVDESSEGMSDVQRARRVDRPDTAIGGAAEHAAWHDEIGATAIGTPGEAPKRQGVLRRYADGSARGAIVLSEILGKPRGGRTDD